MMGAIRDRVDYRVGATSAATTASEALTAGEGVCQDHAHIFIAACRAADVPARYVTGYLLMSDAAPETHDAHHAWAEAWVEGLGWIGFDVANRICPTDHYVRMATALDAYYAAPVRGTRRGGEAERLEVAVLVQQASAQQ
jgi:transglutaminase-like putative cysteine protease